MPDNPKEQILQAISELQEQMNDGFSKIDQRFEEMDKRFEQVDQRFERMDERFRQVDKRFDDMDERMNKLQDSMAKKNFENETAIYQLSKACDKKKRYR